MTALQKKDKFRQRLAILDSLDASFIGINAPESKFGMHHIQVLINLIKMDQQFI